MPTDTIVISRILPAAPGRIYAAWLDAAEHAAMTGSPATVEAPVVGGRFTAWDGYIDGSFLTLEPGTRIVLSWRSDDFPADALDSLLEVELEPAPGGTRVTLRHGDLPEGQGPALLEGWEQFYLEPMARYFGKGKRGGAPGAKGARKASARPGRAGKKAAKPTREARKAPRKASAGTGRKVAARRSPPKPRRPAKRAARRPAPRKGARRR